MVELPDVGVIGDCGVDIDWRKRRGVVWLALLPEYWGKGYGKEKRAVDEILKERTVWGCRDVTVVLKHFLLEAKIVEGVRICSPGGHVWVEYNGQYYDVSGEFHPVFPTWSLHRRRRVGRRPRG